MKTARKQSGMQAKNITYIVAGTAILLLVPLLAMQFTNEVRWSLSDFVIMGVLLIGTGLVFEFGRAKVQPKHRPILAVVLVVMMLLVWAELAVGMFGTPISGS